jgi:hypothetical protein
MKKITLLSFLLASFMMFGQSIPFDFEGGTGDQPQFQFDGANYSIIANPDMSAGNMSASVLQIEKLAGAAWFAGFGWEPPTYTGINLANGTVFTMKIWSTKANLPIRFQLQGGGNPTYNRDVVVTTPNTWTEITFDFSVNEPGENILGTEQFPILVIQPDYDPGCEGGSCPPIAVGGTYYIDDIVQVGAPEPTCTDGVQNGNETGVDCGGPDCPVCPPSCTDGVQNGNETGVDCGGPDCPECPAADPTAGPETDASTGTDMYIYSGLSGNANESDFAGFNLVDFAGGVTISEPVLDGNKVIKLENLDFTGSGLGLNFNATGAYTFVHLQYYATTATAFNFSLVDDSLSQTVCCGNPAEPFYTFGNGADAPLTKGEWVSVFIPLQHFNDFNSGWDGTDIKQTLVTGSGTIYLDNIFFSTTNVLSVDNFATTEFKVFPNPTNSDWTILGNSVINNVTVYDILGKQVIALEPNATNTKIDASSLKSGMYFARIEGVNGSKTIKIVKE